MPMTVRYTAIDGEAIAEKRDGVRRLYVPYPLGSTVAPLGRARGVQRACAECCAALGYRQ